MTLWCGGKTRNASSAQLLLSERLLRGIDDVEEPVLVLLPPVQVGDAGPDRRERGLVDQEEEGLVGVQLQAAPDDVDQLAHGDVVGDQELDLVQHWQLLLALEALDHHRDLVRVQLADLLHVLHALGCKNMRGGKYETRFI